MGSTARLRVPSMIQLFGSFSLVANSWASMMSTDSVTPRAISGLVSIPICALTFIPSLISRLLTAVVGQGSQPNGCFLTFEGPRFLSALRDNVFAGRA
jgi:hypothetical protein